MSVLTPSMSRLGRITWLLVLLVTWIHCRSALAADLIEQFENARVQGIARAIPSTVCVFVPGGAGGGSGVVISPDGFALTNFHVSSPAGTYMRCGMADGEVYDAVVVGIDPVGDLALIKLLGRDDFPVASFVESRKVRVGDWCFASGNPFLLATNLQPTITYGIISGTQRYQYPSGTLLEYGSCFQTDASINPGNSGGPLYAAKGELIGIIGRASFEKRGRVNVGVGYAISGDQAQNFLGCLHSGRVLDHATLGATVGTEDDGGVAVTNILESSDAYRRGLRYGDEIIEIDGRVVQTANDVQNLLAIFPDQWRIPITYRQEGEIQRTLVRLSSVHRPDELLEKMASALPPPPPVPDTPKDEEDADDEEPAGPKEPLEPAPKKPADAPEMLDAGGEPIPELSSSMIEVREGYANYFFNRRKQAEFVQNLRKSLGDRMTSTSGQGWKVTGVATRGEGKRDDAKPFSLLISPQSFEMTIDDDAYRLDSKGDLIGGVDAGGPIGLLAALHAMRRMLEMGPEKFGDTYYWGTMPLLGERPLRNCTVAIDASMEFRFVQHPETGRLEVIEAFSDRDSDPAELWLEENSPAGHPKRLRLRYGLETLFTIWIDDWTAMDVVEDPK